MDTKRVHLGLPEQPMPLGGESTAKFGQTACSFHIAAPLATGTLCLHSGGKLSGVKFVNHFDPLIVHC